VAPGRETKKPDLRMFAELAEISGTYVEQRNKSLLTDL
jgi:hypothetical protein